MRITKKIFVDLAIFMIGFGIIIGIVFPYFMLIMGIPKTYLLTFRFALSCIVAGIIVGLVNIILAKTVVGSKIALMADKMSFVADKIDQAKTFDQLQGCNEEECRLIIDSEDELGRGANSFNTLLKALSEALSSEGTIRSFTALMSNQIELEALTKGALTYLLEFLKAEAGAIILERGGEFFIPSSLGIKDTNTILSNPNLWKFFEKREVQKLSLDKDLEIDGLLLSIIPKEVYSFPLLYKEVPLGLLVVGTTQEISERQLQTLEMCIQSLSISLNNSITYDQLQKLAANDPLTGLYNRRFGLQRLSEEFSRSIRSQMPLGILMFDIDHFKRVNDTYGHAAGDRVLINVAKIATMAARKGDFVIRYGGEEFIMILPGAGKKDCLFIGERLRHMVEESVVQTAEAQMKVTISVGFVSYPEYAVDDEHALTKAADEALYLAKERGRNMVIYAP